MPTSANGKYLPPYDTSVAIVWPSSSLEKKKNVRHENRIPSSERTKFIRYEAICRKSRLTKAQILNSVPTAGVLLDDLGEDLRKARFTARALEQERPARDGLRDELRDRGGRVGQREVHRHAGSLGPVRRAADVGNAADIPESLEQGRRGVHEAKAIVLAAPQPRADLRDAPGREDVAAVDDPHRIGDLLG